MLYLVTIVYLQLFRRRRWIVSVLFLFIFFIPVVHFFGCELSFSVKYVVFFFVSSTILYLYFTPVLPTGCDEWKPLQPDVVFLPPLPRLPLPFPLPVSASSPPPSLVVARSLSRPAAGKRSKT